MLDAFESHGPSLTEHAPVAVGHRVVHGGARFFEATLIDDLVEINIDDLSVLAPLHNPGALQGIRAARRAFDDVPHVAVFDTAFHQTMPAEAYTYALERATAEKHRIRRYGFHGTSHKFVSEAAAVYLDRPLSELKQVVFHLGNGASVTAVDGGRSVDTSMGFTPLEGLVMGTRTGDIDPAILLHLQRRAGLTTNEIDDLLNKRSGLVGLAGANDMRDLTARSRAGDADAQLAIDVYTAPTSSASRQGSARTSPISAPPRCAGSSSRASRSTPRGTRTPSAARSPGSRPTARASRCSWCRPTKRSRSRVRRWRRRENDPYAGQQGKLTPPTGDDP
jgi:acetate kinase